MQRQRFASSAAFQRHRVLASVRRFRADSVDAVAEGDLQYSNTPTIGPLDYGTTRAETNRDCPEVEGRLYGVTPE